MSPLLELPRATYSAPHAGLHFHLNTALALPPGSHLVLEGSNGAGKSTFLEKILIPALRPAHTIVYLAQDMALQRTTMAVTLALLGHHVPTSLPDLALAWIRASNCRDILILDEFDKYLRTDQYMALGIHNFSWAVTVSHLSQQRASSSMARGFKLTLHRDQEQPRVLMDLVQLW